MKLNLAENFCRLCACRITFQAQVRQVNSVIYSSQRSSHSDRKDASRNHLPADRDKLEMLKTFRFLRPKLKYTEASYVLDSALASRLVERVWPIDENGRENLGEEKSRIWEIGPGPGVLTQELLERGVKQLKVFEADSQFHPTLDMLARQTSEGRLDIIPDGFFKIDSINLERNNSLTASNLFPKNLQKRPWEEDVFLKVIGNLTCIPDSRKGFHQYVANLLKRISIHSYGRVQLNLLMHPSDYERIFYTFTKRRKSRNYMSFLFEICCNITIIHKEPRSSFYPKSEVENKNGDRDLYLVQITAKRDMPSILNLTLEEVDQLIIFVSQIAVTLSLPLATALKRWIPGSVGAALRSLDYRPDQKVLELSGADLLRIFQHIKGMDDFTGRWLLDSESVTMMREVLDRNSWPSR